MMRKGLAVVVMLLFIGMCVVPSTAVQELGEKQSPVSFEGNTLYVGGSGPNNYTKIQDAIDNARDGDTVFVYNGIYNEQIFINNSIKLIGENRDLTVIDGNYSNHVLQVFASRIEITGFTIQNGVAQDPFTPAAGIHLIFSNCNVIHDNIIENNGVGIHVCRSHHNTIQNNSISENTYGIKSGSLEMFGDFFVRSIGNKIFDNDISYNAIGILISYESYTIISHNLLFKNNEGIRAYTSWKNTIKENKICSHTDHGICLYGSSNNNIFSNIISGNELGIRLRSYSRKNDIYNNNFLNSKEHANFVCGIFARNRFDGNYWDINQSKPYIIHGFLELIDVPWIYIDWNPAQEPYDIGR